MKPETIAIHGGYESEATTKAVAVPIYQTVAYEFDNAQHGADLFNLTVPGNIYTPVVESHQRCAGTACRSAGRWRGRPGAQLRASGD